MTGLRSRYDFDGHVLLHVKTLWIVAIGYSFTSFELYGRGSPRTRFLTKIDTLGQRQWSSSKRSDYLRHAAIIWQSSFSQLPVNDHSAVAHSCSIMANSTTIGYGVTVYLGSWRAEYPSISATWTILH
ncbi:unnamed protein product [Somion occarium]|uniref:Uncharacterized protein n=1 Tax=Somion occarium TaxID=3059160 RepID=A0ABP1CQ51_9APHY